MRLVFCGVLFCVLSSYGFCQEARWRAIRHEVERRFEVNMGRVNLRPIPVSSSSHNTRLTFSLKDRKLTWEEGIQKEFAENVPKALLEEDLRREHFLLVMPHIDVFNEGEVVGDGKECVLVGDVIDFPGVMSFAKNFLFLKPMKGTPSFLKFILLERLQEGNSPLFIKGKVCFKDEASMIKEFMTIGCRVILGVG